MWLMITPVGSDSSWDADWVPRNNPWGEIVGWNELSDAGFLWHHFTINYELILGGVDFSRRGIGVSLFDFAFMLSWVEIELNRTGKCLTSLSNMDLWFSFELRNELVYIQASYVEEVAVCSLGEIAELSSSAVFDSFRLIGKFHPECRNSHYLKNKLQGFLRL
ncbi:hypothetical protein [Glycomyces algeriensis]|uniref:hypothetical protein n=1 Tax=Glycomyces algeriensis TaxID=256037 RepID=UPI0022D25C85|nr:hypothetical protein [Glycomyces algeriensis]MDA1365861.1 hypothetical protein [Glycomyces algeriensis]MDR7349374.1 hypothetical protein [Glycomyces algeriensis]